jgi:HTH-type transcriptional regulator/antitoxin HigA
MELRPIRTKRAYRTALKEAETLWRAPEGSEEGDRLEVLTLLIAEVLIRKYELKNAA